VDTSHIVLDPSGGPYHSFIVVDASGHRNVFYNPALYNVVGADDLSDSLIQSASLVLLDHITEPSLQGVAAKVKKLGVPILGDIEGPTETSVRLAALSDYLVVPKAFATWASDELEPKNSCAALAQGGRLATVVTAGVEGCYLSTPRNPTVRHFPAFRVDAFDTNGCGDTFHGAFALAVARGIDIEDTITFASAAAALKAIAGGGKRRGWDAIPTLEEVFQFLKAHLMEPERTTMLERLKTLRD
jgi:sugar/nucleoside kinase (ribokinase family)